MQIDQWTTTKTAKCELSIRAKNWKLIGLIRQMHHTRRENVWYDADEWWCWVRCHVVVLCCTIFSFMFKYVKTHHCIKLCYPNKSPHTWLYLYSKIFAKPGWSFNDQTTDVSVYMFVWWRAFKLNARMQTLFANRTDILYSGKAIKSQ